jgi:predicted secreted protein
MRQRRRRLLGIIITTLIALAALSALAWQFRAPLLQLVPTPPVVVTERDQGRVIQLIQGQRLEVRLPSNRTSGRFWRNDIPLPFLTPTGEMRFAENPSAKKPGDGVQSTMFRATGRGTGPLFMSYLSVADENSYAPSASFRVVVVVR